MKRATLFVFLLLVVVIVLAVVSQFFAPQMATSVYQAFR